MDGNAGTDQTRHRETVELMNLTLDDAKAAARTLRRRLAEAGTSISHGLALETVAQQIGFKDWNTASARLSAEPAGTGAAVPVLRIQDEAVARTFYVDYLGFAVEWEHRFEPGMPLYVCVRRDETVLHLSEHHGDGTPGTVVWIPLRGVEAFHAELSGRPHPRLRPGIDRDAPGGPTVEVIDPFGNVLRFCEPTD
ncbi:catechol 2,3-dioxygenase-like lactoylglutathione lyase family enzyme [Conexibacter arvalis]|uniref:Bleomycin resistance protein n=2 Tax=Conexibacter arvalis TaxID=912552 RepID=A0A840IHB7_9ACTN|nr:catechol 2,3-dioxygenase-like lactoylglutathione lyase family enzyme [Conexibacter arvalis]